MNSKGIKMNFKNILGMVSIFGLAISFTGCGPSDGTDGTNGSSVVSSAPVNAGDVNVSVGTNVIFNTSLYSSGNISYNAATGVITFNVADRYIVRWSVSTDGLVNPTDDSTAKPVTFALSSSQGDFIRASTPLSTGQLSGIGIVDVTAAPVTLSLVNASSYGVQLANMPVNATLVVTDDSNGSIALQVERISN